MNENQFLYILISGAGGGSVGAIIIDGLKQFGFVDKRSEKQVIRIVSLLLPFAIGVLFDIGMNGLNFSSNLAAGVGAIFSSKGIHTVRKSGQSPESLKVLWDLYLESATSNTDIAGDSLLSRYTKAIEIAASELGIEVSGLEFSISGDWVSGNCTVGRNYFSLPEARASDNVEGLVMEVLEKVAQGDYEQ